MNWQELEQECRRCQRCSLCENRRNVVFGVGSRTSPVIFIGEGPGEQEDLRGEPFVGPAGRFFDLMLSMIDLDRSQVYIANIVKCRPPRNRDPLNLEQDACIGYLLQQIALLRPKLIVCLGRIAAMRMIDRNFRITREHGKWFDHAGIPMMALYHPSALLRDPDKRPDTFVDLKGLQAKIREVCPELYENRGE